MIPVPLPPSIALQLPSGREFEIPGDCLNGRNVRVINAAINKQREAKASRLLERCATEVDEQFKAELRSAARDLLGSTVTSYDQLAALHDPDTLQAFLQSALGVTAQDAREIVDEFPQMPILVHLIRRASGWEDELKNWSSRLGTAGPNPPGNGEASTAKTSTVS